MADELPDRLTPVTRAEIITAMWHAWMRYFGQAPPCKEALWVLLAQWALETGWGKFCHNHNLGNAKSREGDGFDYQYFACNEILPIKQAEAMAKASPTTAKITSRRTDGKAVIWLYPKHPGCRFRAFTNLLDGAIDHLHLVANRYQKAWPKVLAGDVVAYSKALKAQGYYTADEAKYTVGVKRCYDTIATEPFDYDSLPILSDAEQARLQSLVARTIQMSVDDAMLRSRAHLDDDD